LSICKRVPFGTPGSVTSLGGPVYCSSGVRIKGSVELSSVGAPVTFCSESNSFCNELVSCCAITVLLGTKGKPKLATVIMAEATNRIKGRAFIVALILIFLIRDSLVIEYLTY
jgi:hypothetical protein